MISGLSTNASKSLCFLSNVPSDQADQIISCLGFQLGSLPAKFLGVPLITSKLSLTDCQPLLEKIKARMSFWTNNFLSYAGRLQLLKSVIFAIQAYWSAHFILPATAIKSIQSTMSRFLWHGLSMQKNGAKVAWNKITLPLSEGGLAIKHLSDWNRALFLSLLLRVINPSSSSFWAGWVKKILLKKKHFWCTNIPSDCSWTWRKILNLRHIALSHIRYCIGNGENTSLWFDPWSSGNVLCPRIDHPLISNSRLGTFSTVSSILHNATWVLPSSNHPAVIDFRRNFDFNMPCNPDSPDAIYWDGTNIKDARTGLIWESIRQRGQPKAWHKIVWHQSIPPRHSFLLWLAYNRGLRTKDRLINYGLMVDPQCVLCNSGPESFDHLFFHCPFSFHVLTSVMRVCGWRGFSGRWADLSRFLLARSSSGIHTSLLHLGLAAVVYNLWQERNARLHGRGALPTRTIASNTLHIVKCKMHSNLKFQRGIANFRHLDLYF